MRHDGNMKSCIFLIIQDCNDMDAWMYYTRNDLCMILIMILEYKRWDGGNIIMIWMYYTWNDLCMHDTDYAIGI